MLLALMLAWSPARAGVLADGSTAFEEGDLDGAIAAWEQGLEGGNPAGKALYDLGNAWYRKGDLPRAVAYYRNAQQLRPRDGNVHHNLALARSELSGVPQPVPVGMVWMALVTSAELGVLGLLLAVVGSGSAVLWWRRRLRSLLIASGAALTLGLWISGAAWWGAHSPGVAVVVDQEAVVRDAAQPDGAERFRLPPGAEVNVLRAYGDFELIQDGRGRRGWVPSSAVLSPG